MIDKSIQSRCECEQGQVPKKCSKLSKTSIVDPPPSIETDHKGPGGKSRPSQSKNVLTRVPGQINEKYLYAHYNVIHEDNK